MNEPPSVPKPDFQWNAVLASLTDCWPTERWSDVGVLVGCSGGADSVGLLRALGQLRRADTEAGGFLAVAHYNHRLRGAESEDDEAFVRQLAETHALEFECKRGDGSVRDEATLREQRLQFFLATAKRIGARYIAVGHTLDDNVETVLHHLLRGTGPSGLAGIAPTRALENDFILIRPLRLVRRGQLRVALHELGQSWREDSSNARSDYRRNWIRNQLIPMIQTQYPDAADAIGRAVEGQRMWRETIDRQAADWLSEHRFNSDDIQIRRDPNTDSAIVVAALQQLWDEQNWPRQAMARPHWTRLAATVRGDGSERYSMPSAIEVVAERDRLSICPPGH